MAKKLGERLVEAGLITQDAVEKALQHQKITGNKLGECLVEIGLIQENALLRFLAGELNTRFVSAEKLAKAKIPPAVLDKVPVRMAEAQIFLPVAFDPEQKILSIVASEPKNEDLLSEIALVTGAQDVYAYIGLRSAINAGIRKHYYGDPTAFSALESGNSPQALRADLSAITNAYESTGTESRARLPPLRYDTDSRIRQRAATGGTQLGPQPTVMRELTSLTRPAVADNDFAETLNILVGMLETSRKDLRGHSGQLARQGVQAARWLGLTPREVTSVAIAAYLHDLGKPRDRHLTLAAIAANPEWKEVARRYHRVPIKLFEQVRLPSAANTILAQLFEAYDGSGVPQGAKGGDITIGARILAAVDSYLDLTKNGANAHGRLFSRDEALAHLAEQAGKLYDPAVVDIVGRLQTGELLRQRLATDGRQILIADPEEAVRTDLVDSLSRLGLVTEALGSLEGAVDTAISGEVDVVVVGLRFGTREILGLVDLLRKQPATASVPVVVLGQPQDANGRQALAQVGISEALPMPLDPDQAAGTIANLYNDRIRHGGPARPVRGSLDELGQIELLRLMAAGRKSGRLTLQSGGREGFLHLEQGRVVFASFNGQAAAPAVRALMTLREADFTYDADALLLDLPHLAADVELIVREFETRPAE